MNIISDVLCERAREQHFSIIKDSQSRITLNFRRNDRISHEFPHFRLQSRAHECECIGVNFLSDIRKKSRRAVRISQWRTFARRQYEFIAGRRSFAMTSVISFPGVASKFEKRGRKKKKKNCKQLPLSRRGSPYEVSRFVQRITREDCYPPFFFRSLYRARGCRTSPKKKDGIKERKAARHHCSSVRQPRPFGNRTRAHARGRAKEQQGRKRGEREVLDAGAFA